MPSNNPVITGGGAGASDCVERVSGSDGSRTYYDTITLAQAAASANDMLNCYLIANENALGKNGVGYLFPPGAGITYTSANTTSIWTDGGTAMEFKIYGQGKFVRGSASGGPAFGEVTDISHASSIVHFEAAHAEGQKAATTLYVSNGKLIFDVDVVKQTGADGYAIKNVGGSFYGNVDELVSLTGSGLGTSGSSECYLDIDKASVKLWAVEQSGTGTTTVHAKNITATGTANLNSAILCGNGTLYLDVLGECISTGWHAVRVAGGTCRLEGRFKTTGSNMSAIQLAGGTCSIDSGSTLIGNGTGNCITAASAQSVKLYGAVVANLDKHANVSVEVGQLIVDPNVS